MYQVLTAAEIQAKGITKRQVKAMLARAEKLCNWYAKRHAVQGDSTTAEQVEWDAACAKWDHLKATLAVMQ